MNEIIAVKWLTSLQKLKAVTNTRLVACEHETSVLLGLLLVDSDLRPIGDATTHYIVHISIADYASGLSLADVRCKWAISVIVDVIVKLVHPCMFRTILVGIQFNRSTYRPS